MKNLQSLSKLRSDVVLCTVDVAGLYPNIPHEEGLSALRKRLDNWKEKYISYDMLCDLPKVSPKSNIIKFCRKVFKQKRRTVIGTKFIPPYSNQFMAELEEGVLKKAELKTYLWWKYIDDTLFLWKHGEEN